MRNCLSEKLIVFRKFFLNVVQFFVYFSFQLFISCLLHAYCHGFKQNQAYTERYFSGTVVKIYLNSQKNKLAHFYTQTWKVLYRMEVLKGFTYFFCMRVYCRKCQKICYFSNLILTVKRTNVYIYLHSLKTTFKRDYIFYCLRFCRRKCARNCHKLCYFSI